MVEVDRTLLEDIDKLELSELNKTWRKAMKSAGWRIYPDRERWTVKSWKETEGEDLQIRRAKLVACVLDNLEIKIHEFDEIVGRPTPGVIGCATAIDCVGDYIPDIWNDDGKVSATMDVTAILTRDELEILRESARTFRSTAYPEMVRKAWESLVGDWAADAEAAKLKDPGIDVGVTGQSTATLNWPKILRVGLRGFINEAQEHIDAYIAVKGHDINKIFFWKSAIITLEAAIRHANRYAELAKKMAAETTDPAYKARLENIAEVCMYVPENPPRTFQEALQSMQFCNLCKMLESPNQNNCQWGRADQYLYPYFVRDLKNGVPLEKLASVMADLIGRWGTQTYVQNSTQKDSHQINFGINNIMVGGIDKNNEDCSNELSYMILCLVGKLQISSPTVGLRWNSKTPDWLMRKAIHTNIETRGGIPLFENDEVVIPHYVKDGIPFNEAVDWGGLGCVYPCIPTRAEHTGAHGSAALNLAAMFDMTMHNGIDINGKQTGLKSGDPRDFKNFEELYQAFLQQHKYVTHRAFWLAGVARDQEPNYFRTPLLSILGIDASMELGQDLMFAHPDFSLFGVGDRAIIDAANSLYAVYSIVYKNKLLTMDELMNALDANFEGERGEMIRQMCLSQPKFGNDDEEVDAMVRRVSTDSVEIIHSYDNAPYHRYMVAREGLAWHYFGGLGCRALPTGRKAFEPLSDGSLSPMQGTDVNGPTAVIRSACNSCFSDVSYASVLNQKLSASLLQSEESIDKLIAYTNAFMSAGGSHIQYNITDMEELVEAKVKPEEHKDLIVRIGGFSAYFVQLSPEIQDDVICRSEFNL